MAANDPHGPNRQSHYFNIHEKVIRDLIAEGFVIADRVSVAPFGSGYLLMQGTIECLGDIEVSVEKLLIVRPQKSGEPTVQTTEYSYNARIRGAGNILRYDSPHESHNQFHHVHRYNVFERDGEGVVEESSWPTLGDVLFELRDWYYEHYDQITALLRGP